MIEKLSELLTPTFSFFNVFRYISVRTAYAAVTALVISYLMGSGYIRLLTRLKLGQTIREDGPQTHLKKGGTPTMGGGLMLFSVILSILLWQNLSSLYTWLSLSALVGFGLIGFIDDYLKVFRKSSEGLRGRIKLAGQLLISVFLTVFLYLSQSRELMGALYIPFFKNPVWNMGWLFIPFGVFVIVGTSNAVNLTDGLDGLAVGLLFIAFTAFGVISYLTGHAKFADYLNIPFIKGAGELSITGFAIMGACIGFLWFNCHPAEIMMGDSGSLSMGGMLGLLAVMVKKEILLGIIGGVFVMETLSVILQVFFYKRTGKRIFLMAPLHHHFELSGWPENKVVTRFWILGGMLAILGISTLKVQ